METFSDIQHIRNMTDEEFAAAECRCVGICPECDPVCPDCGGPVLFSDPDRAIPVAEHRARWEDGLGQHDQASVEAQS